MKKLTALILALVLVLSFSTSTTAAEEKQYDYATDANSGVRDEVCTSLLGTAAGDYYTGANSYESLSTLESDALLSALRTLMTDTHTYQSTYANCRDWAVKTDCENGDGTTVSLLYTGYSATWDDWCNNRPGSDKGWNREHVWPQSSGGFNTTGVGADLHHVRPSDQVVNADRGNLKYGNVTGGSISTGAAYTGRAPGGSRSGTYFEPLDNVKGDVARICLYVYVRYGGQLAKCGNLDNVFESVDVLLAWCALDPVDTWEMGRNEVVGAIQGNRNVFIDYPELAWLLFDRDIPNDMITPSGEAGQQTPAGCAHAETILRNHADATCHTAGYTGDTHCADCGVLLQTGSAIPATGAHTYGQWTDDPETGLRQRSCTLCGHSETMPMEPTVPSQPSEPTQPTPPTEETTQPTVETTPPSETTPASPSQPTVEPTVPAPQPQEEPEYLWLVYGVIGVGTLVSILMILIPKKKS